MAPVTRVGNPDRPAYEALQSLRSVPRFAVIRGSRPHTGISHKTLLSAPDPSGNGHWARDGVFTHVDLGVTVGKANDPLAGISRFKRTVT